TAPILGSLQTVNLQLNEGSTISLGQGLAGSASLAMNSVDITYQGAATLNLPKLSSFTNGTLVLAGNGQVFNGPQANRIDGSINGSRIAINDASTFTVTATNYDTGTRFTNVDMLSTGGTGATLNAPNLQTINGAVDFDGNPYTQRIAARNGGTINLPSLTTVAGGAGNDTLEFLVDGTSSMNLSSLQQITGGNVQ